jgi:hypothetical protein
MSRQIIALVAVAAVVLAAVLASAVGWLGPVSVCGADRTPGCVTWPVPISEALWAGFVVGVIALLIWQVRT